MKAFILAILTACTPIAWADAPPDAGTAILVTDAGTVTDGSAASVVPASGSAGSASPSVPVVAVDPESGSATSSDGQIDTLPEVKAAYDELHADYTALQAGKPGERTFLFAVLLAAILKYALDGVNAVAKYKYTKAMGWVALFLAVPIALLTKYVADKSWATAIIFAASGPGAIVVHELIDKLKSGTKTTPPSAPPATT